MYLQWNVPILGKDHRMHMVSFPSSHPAFHHSVTIPTAFVFEICTCLNLGTKTHAKFNELWCIQRLMIIHKWIFILPVYLSLCLNAVFCTANKQKLSRNLHGIEHTLHISEWLNNWLIADEQVELYMFTHSYYCAPPVKITLGFLANSLSGETPPQLPALSLDILKVLRVSAWYATLHVYIVNVVIEMVSHLLQ